MPINSIRQFRLEKRVSKKSIAQDLETSVSRITAIENGAKASPEEYALISLFLDVAVDEIYPKSQSEWPEIKRKKQIIEIKRNIDLEDLKSQVKEQERLQKEIRKKKKEKNNINKNLKKINNEHETRLREHEDLTDKATKNRVLRELNFPPEYQEAGITILQGFVKLIKRKYGDENVSITIKQTGLKVVLIIKTPDGKVDEISEYLDKFSRVISGDLEVKSLTNDPIALIELKSQLKVAELQVQQQRDINLMLKTDHDRRIESLEKENDWFKEQLALAVESSKSITQEILSQLKNNDSQIAILATKLVDVVNKSEQTSKDLSVVGKKAEVANSTIEELNKLILKEGVGRGVAVSVRKLIKWATFHLIG